MYRSFKSDHNFNGYVPFSNFVDGVPENMHGYLVLGGGGAYLTVVAGTAHLPIVSCVKFSES